MANIKLSVPNIRSKIVPYIVSENYADFLLPYFNVLKLMLKLCFNKTYAEMNRLPSNSQPISQFIRAFSHSQAYDTFELTDFRHEDVPSHLEVLYTKGYISWDSSQTVALFPKS